MRQIIQTDIIPDVYGSSSNLPDYIARFNSLLLYFICILWAIVLVACLIFGSGFAFYAMFAAIAIELIGAVYYTFQLK